MTEGTTQLRATLGIGGLFELVPDAVIVGDAMTGTVVLWNEAAEDLFGYAAAAAGGMRLDALVPPELKDQHAAGVARFARTGTGDLVATHRLVEVPALRASGERIWVELRLAKLGGPDSSRYVVAVIRDVTARRLAEEEARANAEQAQQSAAAMRDFVSMVSHDLRAPVAGIKGAHDLLRQRWDQLTPEMRTEIFAGAERQTARVITLLGDLLDLSRAESGQLSPQLVPLVVGEVLAEALESAGFAVTIDPTAAAVRVQADRDHLRRILLNLISNAHKYGGPPITVSATRDADVVRLHVDDAGPGVNEAFAPRLFDRFTRGEDRATTGHGLGLSIVKALVEAGGGEVSYRPLSPGSRFTVRLPAAD